MDYQHPIMRATYPVWRLWYSLRYFWAHGRDCALIGPCSSRCPEAAPEQGEKR